MIGMNSIQYWQKFVLSVSLFLKGLIILPGFYGILREFAKILSSVGFFRYLPDHINVFGSINA